MRPEICMCCNDESHYNTLLYQVTNIENSLRRIISKNEKIERNNEYWKLKNEFSNDRQHPHFMCGVCYKVNTTQLTHIEDEIDELLACYILSKNKNKTEYRKILHYLSGYYPLKYRIFEREVSKRN